MFIHSIKVHRIYKLAAKIIEQVCEEGKGVKDLIFQQKRVNIQTLNALVVQTLQHARELNLLLRQSNILIDEPRLDPWLARVLMTEILWGRIDKVLESEAKPVKTVLSYQKKFQAILRDSTLDVQPNALTEVYRPKYVRVNTLLITIQEAVDGFRSLEWVLVRIGANCSYRDHLQAVSKLEPNEFIQDYHIPELFVFPPRTKFHDYQCYLEGKIVLQDKASCMAAHLLNPAPGSAVLDMCAAPGMKTTHLAAIMGNRGAVYAVERDLHRYQILQRMVETTGATCVQTHNGDALKVKSDQCPDVEYILVDPSCTGTGMLDRRDIASHEEKVNEARVRNLSGFQILVLRRALTAYPKAKRVLYSTCSVMTQENEQVIKEVLETTKQFRLVPVKELLGQKEWLSYGSDEYKEIGENCLYAKSEIDYTNGFFMAVFERIAPHDEMDVYVRGRKWKDLKRKNTGEEGEGQVPGQEEDEEVLMNEEVECKPKKSKKKKKDLKRTEDEMEGQMPGQQEEIAKNGEDNECKQGENKCKNVKLIDTDLEAPEQEEVDRKNGKLKKSKKKSKDDLEFTQPEEQKPELEDSIQEDVNSKLKKSKRKLNMDHNHTNIEVEEHGTEEQEVLNEDESSKPKKCKKSKKSKKSKVQED